MVPINPVDLRLLAAMQANPGASLAELADTCGMSQTPCWRRLKRMQDEGIVRDRSWTIDGGKVGLSINLFAEVRLKQHDEETLAAFEEAVADRPEIVECFTMSGESDYVLRIMVDSVATYESLLRKILLHLPGVAAINSRLALKAVKLTTQLPLQLLREAAG